MFDFYEPIRRSMFAYFCRHHGKVIEAAFAIPKKLKIRKNKRSSFRKGSSIKIITNDSLTHRKNKSLTCKIQETERQALQSSYGIQATVTKTNQIDLDF